MEASDKITNYSIENNGHGTQCPKSVYIGEDD